MIKSKSLVNGIGNNKQTQKYYDNWANYYEVTLSKWNYQAPKKCINVLKKQLVKDQKCILDLACGTGLFGLELRSYYKKSIIFGTDISSKSLIIAKKKNVYSNLKKINFEEKYPFRLKFNLVSLIGSMTYCKNLNKLFANVKFYLVKNGHFIFSHRTDLWKSQNFDFLLSNLSKNFKIKYVSRPCNYLPSNKDFKNKIKIRIVLLQKS